MDTDNEQRTAEGIMEMTKMEKLIAWMKQPSTWQGIIVGLGLCGVLITPEQKEGIIILAAGATTLLQIFVSKN